MTNEQLACLLRAYQLQVSSIMRHLHGMELATPNRSFDEAYTIADRLETNLLADIDRLTTRLAR
jgi:hypothetical protein